MKEVEEGFCNCGCGQETKIAPYSSRREGWIKGRPLSFVHGHNAWKPVILESDTPYLCECGCGMETKVNSKTCAKKGFKRGYPQRFIKGHWNRGSKLWEDKKYREKMLLVRLKTGANPETRKHLSEAKKRDWQKPEYIRKHTESMKRNWQNPEYVKKQMKSRSVRPNKPEMMLNTILEDIYPNEWKYVGDGQIVIAGKCPDFINCNGKKLIIELYGDFWHQGQDPEDRVKIFRPYGYKTLVVWERELSDTDGIRKHIQEFVEANR